MDDREAAPPLPADTRRLAQVLAARLELPFGRARVELELDDGKLVALWRHQRITATALWQYDAVET